MVNNILGSIDKSLENEKRQVDRERQYSHQAYDKWLEKGTIDEDGVPKALKGLLCSVVPQYADKLTSWMKDSKASKNAHVKPFLKSLDLPMELIVFTALCDLVKKNVEEVQMSSKVGHEPDRQLTIQSISFGLFDKLVAESNYKRVCKSIDKRALEAYNNNMSYTNSTQHKMDVLKNMIRTYKVVGQTVPADKLTSVRPILDIILNDVQYKGETISLIKLDNSRACVRGKASKVLRTTNTIMDYVDKHDKFMSFLVTTYRPMVCPPKDWTGIMGGGYLTPVNNNTFVKFRRDSKVNNLEISQGVYNAINTLQRTPWKINKKIYELISKCFKDGGNYEDPHVIKGVINKHCLFFDDKYRALVQKHKAEVKADTFGTESHVLPKEIWEREMPKYKELMKSRKKMELTLKQEDKDGRIKAREMTSLTLIGEWKLSKQVNMGLKKSHDSKVMSAQQQLLIASEYVNEEEIYFPYDLDFRGRAYSLSNYLNPQGDEIAKSLLTFAQGKRLGNSGLFWLRVHGANCYAEYQGVKVDKLDFQLREKFVLDNEWQILESARNPMGTSFWQEADKPLLFLAFCFEYQEYMESDLGEDFISHLPCAMDATCSGLQHYSALLKDEVGGQQVNLTPTMTPEDIYKSVAQVASRRLDECISNTECVILKQLYRLWLGKVDRTLCKRATMTKPYGVTTRGIRDQLIELLNKGKKQLDVPFNKKVIIEDKECSAVYKACSLMGDILEASVDEIVKSATYGQYWLQENSLRIVSYLQDSGKASDTVSWITPYGFEVRQEYKKRGSKRINLYLNSTPLKLKVPDGNPKVNKMKEKSGIAPNVIHSLDACHLQMTVNECYEDGIDSFAVVHDSFGTHASDVSNMMRIIRKTFADMYSDNVLQNILNYWKKTYPEADLLELDPEQFGTLDIRHVSKSKFFFS